jgi:hypothetical protein
MEEVIMDTFTETGVPEFRLGAANRLVRGGIGAAALLAIFFTPGLTAGWLFILAFVNFYASMTAILGFDFVGATITVIAGEREEHPEPPRPAVEQQLRLVRPPQTVRPDARPVMEAEYRKAA